MPLGLYISVPFCRSKCSYCNFASDVFSSSIFQRYIDRVCAGSLRSAEISEEMGGVSDRAIDSVYLGGGTPTVLDIAELQRLFVTISQNFDVQPGSEITVECAPGTLTPALLDLLPRCGVNRVSLGAQSFIDQESRSVGRLHTRTTVIDDIARLRAAGIENINIDLISGLPYQTLESWNLSLSHVIDSAAPHVSVYMLEVDEDSRLGRELIAGGTRYHAHFVPDEDSTAEFYLEACKLLNGAGVQQYEISNFAREGFESRHNLKYWTRQPYFGFGVDAHSMLEASADPYILLSAEEGHLHERYGSSAPCEMTAANIEAVRFSTPDSLDEYLAGKPLNHTLVSRQAALEETLFLGLRLTRGVDLKKVAAEFGADAVSALAASINEFEEIGLLERRDDVIRLTPRGRLLSNEVFERFIAVPAA